MPLSQSAAGLPTPQILSTATLSTVGMANISGATGASGAWGTANRVLLHPVRVTDTRTYSKAWWVNGATISGNVDVGIYTLSGTTATRVVASTAQAQATASVLQVATTFTTTTLVPGLYYIAMSMSSATATVWRLNVQSGLLAGSGYYYAETSHPLPATLTVLGNVQGILPLCGLSELAAI